MIQFKYITLVISILLIFGCTPKQKESKIKSGKIGGDLIIFHAGSLSLPLKQVFADFKKEYPEVNILAEAAGSRDCARKISDLGKPCDVFLSADYQVINQLLISSHANWSINFANNEMVIAYNSKSKFTNEINPQNWHKILLDPNVRFGRSNPDSDPCGYRSVLMIRLAKIFYNLPNEFYDQMIFKDLKYVRPKEVDLLALLETNTIDYMFIYKSIAVQHKLKFISLPPEINLSKPELSEYYKQAEVKLSGKNPGEFITQIGEPIVYGLTIPKSSPNAKTAEAFVAFFLDKNKGLKVMELHGQNTIVPSPTSTFSAIPLSLKKFASQ